MIHTYTDLRRDHSRRHIGTLLVAGRLRRVGTHYVDPEAEIDEVVLEALGLGIRPTCLTAAKHHGLWVPPGTERHGYARRRPTYPEGWVAHGWTAAWPEPDPGDEAESGTETKVRLFFQLRSVPVRAQVQIPGVGRVDLLVGRRWIVECDSRAHHTGEEQYEKDRRRDISAVERGYFTTRLTHGMVFRRWEKTTQRLRAVIRSGQHLVEPARWART